MSSAIVLDHTFSIHVPSSRAAVDSSPRCHVRRRAGGPETVIALPLLVTIAGPPLAFDEHLALVRNLQLIVDEWERLNG